MSEMKVEMNAKGIVQHGAAAAAQGIENLKPEVRKIAVQAAVSLGEGALRSAFAQVLPGAGVPYGLEKEPLSKEAEKFLQGMIQSIERDVLDVYRNNLKQRIEKNVLPSPEKDLHLNLPKWVPDLKNLK